MAEEFPTFNLNTVWQANSTTNNETLSLSYYQGGASLCLFKKGRGSSKRPLAKLRLTSDGAAKLASFLLDLSKSQPETRNSFLSDTYSEKSKGWEQGTDMSLVFVKTDRRTYNIEITSEEITDPIVIKLLASRSYCCNGTPETDEARSQAKLNDLINHLRNDILLRSLSRFFMRRPLNDKGGSSGNRNRGGYGNRGYDRDRASDPYSKSKSDRSRDDSAGDDDFADF